VSSLSFALIVVALKGGLPQAEHTPACVVVWVPQMWHLGSSISCVDLTLAGSQCHLLPFVHPSDWLGLTCSQPDMTRCLYPAHGLVCLIGCAQ